MKNIVKIFTVLFLTLNIMPSIANDEKQQAYDDAYATEQSKANRLLTSASSAATGIGGMELAQGLSEQKADRAAEQSMSAYISTMRCEYGNGKQVKAGMDEIELPGGNDTNLMKYRAEYMPLAADLKERKTALGLKPGIESEEILDKSQMGLYDDSNVGINGGRYASLYRAQMLGSETDQEQIDSAKQTSKARVIGGAVAAGVGVVGGIVGDELINKAYSKTIEKKDSSTYEDIALDDLKSCLKIAGVKQTNKLAFNTFNPSILDLTDIDCKNDLVNANGKNAKDLFADSNDIDTICDKLISSFGASAAKTMLSTCSPTQGQSGNSLKSGIPTNPVVDSTDVDSTDNFEFDMDESLLMDENEFNEAIASQEEAQQKTNENMCRNFGGNWSNGECFCTQKFDTNQNYIKCVTDNSPVVDSADVDSADNFEFEIDESLWMDENEFKEAIASQEEAQQKTNENICKNFHGNWRNGKCFCTSQFDTNQNYIECVTDINNNGQPGSTAPTDNNNGSSTAPSANTGDNNGTGSNSGSNGENNTNVTAPAATNATSTTSGCGNVGQKECTGKYKYYVCKTDDDCTIDKLPANATTGHCVSADRKGYKICTATACKNSFKVSQGACVKKSSSSSNNSGATNATNTSDTNNSTTQTTNDYDQYYDPFFDILSEDMTKNGNYAKAKSIATGQCDILITKWNKNQPCDTGMNAGDWIVRFDYGVVGGTSMCARTTGVERTTFNNLDNGGGYCWCKTLKYKGKFREAYNIAPWVYLKTYDTTTAYRDCIRDCANACAKQIKENENFRIKSI